MASEVLEGGNAESLLVFGYGCRIFDDPEKAMYIEEGRHLIPWNGQDNHRIDRYDGRVHLSDLPDHGSYPEDEEDKALCDEERYRSLRIKDEEEDGNRLEENDPQQRNAGFSYDYEGEESKVYTRPKEQPQLSLRTLANLIEKTAEFIVKEGAQMEILMRAKETENVKFQFLNPDNPYHPIYKQVLEKKRARLKAGGGHSNPLPPLQIQLDVEKSLRNITLPSAAPGLSGETKSSPAPKNSSAYSVLVEKIRENLPPPPPKETNMVVPLPPPVTLPEISQVDSNTVEVFPPKDKEFMMLIDRTASYVAKNGSDTMSVVRKRSPKEFAFLDGDHVNHTYFQYKVALYKEIIKSRKQNNGLGPACSSSSSSSLLKSKASQSSGKSSSKDVTSKDAVSIVEQKFPLLKGFFS